jgi:hypothetical protein
MSLLANITTTTTTKLMSLIILQKRVEIDVQYKLLEPLYYILYKVALKNFRRIKYRSYFILLSYIYT